MAELYPSITTCDFPSAAPYGARRSTGEEDASFYLGQRVDAKWVSWDGRTSKKYYKATILDIHVDETVSLEYQDGSLTEDLPISLIRVPPPEDNNSGFGDQAQGSSRGEPPASWGRSKKRRRAAAGDAGDAGDWGSQVKTDRSWPSARTLMEQRVQGNRTMEAGVKEEEIDGDDLPSGWLRPSGLFVRQRTQDRSHGGRWFDQVMDGHEASASSSAAASAQRGRWPPPSVDARLPSWGIGNRADLMVEGDARDDHAGLHGDEASLLATATKQKALELAELKAFLLNRHLLRYLRPLQLLGIDRLADLIYVSAEDLEDMKMTAIGAKSFQDGVAHLKMLPPRDLYARCYSRVDPNSSKSMAALRLKMEANFDWKLGPPGQVPPFCKEACGTPLVWDTMVQPLYWNPRLTHCFPQAERKPDASKVREFLSMRSGADGRPMVQSFGMPRVKPGGWFRLAWLGASDTAAAPTPWASAAAAAEAQALGLAPTGGPGGRRWLRAWHGCKFEAVYSNAYNGKLLESRVAEHGLGLRGQRRGVQLYRDGQETKAASEARFVPLCNDGIFWSAVWEVQVDPAVEMEARSNGDHWMLPDRSIRLEALWVRGVRNQDMETGLELSPGWDPRMEAHPLETWDPDMPDDSRTTTRRRNLAAFTN